MSRFIYLSEDFQSDVKYTKGDLESACRVVLGDRLVDVLLKMEGPATILCCNMLEAAATTVYVSTLEPELYSESEQRAVDVIRGALRDFHATGTFNCMEPQV